MKPNPSRDSVALHDILGVIAEIAALLGQPRNRVAQRALERCFEMIEACKRLSPSLRDSYPDVPWGNIIALRNMISHEYDKVRIATLWEFAEQRVPALKD